MSSQDIKPLSVLQTEVIETKKASKDSEKEKKLYEQRIFALKNKIAALKKQEEDLNRKRIKVKLQEKNNFEAQKEKKKIRQSIEEMRINKDEELKRKKEKITYEKKKIENGVKKAKDLVKEKKHNEYNQAINEKNNVNVKIN